MARVEAGYSERAHVENTTPTNVPHQTNVPNETEVKAKPKVQSKGAEKLQSKVDKPNNGTSVEKFVNNVFDIIFPLFLCNEVSKKLNVKNVELSSILDDFRGRAAPYLESVTTSLKNALYTAGFDAGFETMLNHVLNGRPSR